MKIKSLFASFFILANIQAQQSQFMFQPNVINPATAGFFNKLSISAMGDYYKFGSGFQTNNTINYNQKIGFLRGGIGARFNYLGFGDSYQKSGGELNYSFHIAKKERFNLAIGTGISIEHERFLTLESSNSQNLIYQKRNIPFLCIGTVAQFGNHTGQLVCRNLNFGDAQGNISLQILYSYDWEINEAFSMKLGARFFSQNNYNTLAFSTIVNYKMFWLNLGFANRDVYTLGAGVDIKEKLRVGVLFDNYYSQLNNGVSSNFGFVLSYRIKNEEKSKITE